MIEMLTETEEIEEIQEDSEEHSQYTLDLHYSIRQLIEKHRAEDGTDKYGREVAEAILGEEIIQKYFEIENLNKTEND